MNTPVEICMGIGATGILQNLQEICRNGYNCCENIAWMEFVAVGNPLGVFGKCATVSFKLVFRQIKCY